MKNINISNYQPSQGENLWPKTKKENTIYEEFLPKEILQPYISCYWMSRIVNIPEEPIFTQVIPDGCIDIIFNIEKLKKGKCGSICGLMTSPEEKIIVDNNHFIGIRFLPGGILHFTNERADFFTDKIISLESVWGNLAFEISERIIYSNSIYQRIDVIENTLLNIISENNIEDRLIKKTVDDIYNSAGLIKIKNLSLKANISQRHLYRIFEKWIGINPKTFSKIVRFQSIFKKLNLNKNMSKESFSYLDKYYDQSHFIKEFKEFYGKVPSNIDF